MSDDAGRRAAVSSRRHLRVVLLVTDLQRGGAPLRLARLAQQLRTLDVEPIVGCLAPRGPVSESLEHNGVRTFACNAQYQRDWRALGRLFRHLREIDPDLVHATLTHANVTARIVARLIGIPVVTSTATIEIERPFHLQLERWTACLDRGHIVNGTALAEHVVRSFHLPRAHVHVVPPSIAPLGPRLPREEARRRLNLPADDFVVAWAGRFDRVKRLDMLITAAAEMKNEGMRLVLIGDGPLRGEIEQDAARRGLGDHVHLPGWQAYVGPLFSAADVFAFPSDTEGMPNAVLQAMAFGLPVIAADIPAMRELAEDERIRLFPAGRVSPLIDALRETRSDPSEASTRAQRARSWAEQHLAPLASAAAVRRVYDAVLNLEAAPVNSA